MKNLCLILFLWSVVGCVSDDERADAYGNFEAREVTVSSEMAGKLVHFSVEDGQTIAANELVALVDTVQVYLKKKQLAAQASVIRSKAGSVLTQLDVLATQEATLQKEVVRIKKLLADEAATQKQYDDLYAQLQVNIKQKVAIRAQNQSVLSELDVLDAQLLLLNDQIERCKLVNPIQGVVLNTYVEETELVQPGKALYKIANLNILELKAYVDGAQLHEIKIGQTVEVAYDTGVESIGTIKGEISWVSATAEFTPKIIQTKKERVNMVYAIKVKVKNDGQLKIGMPGEVRWKREK